MIDLLLFCLLTVVLETAFFWMFRYDIRDEMTVVICANVLTNLVLNLLLMPEIHRSMPMILAAEALVVAVEYMIYSLAFGRGWKLLGLTFAANAISFGVGLLI